MLKFSIFILLLRYSLNLVSIMKTKAIDLKSKKTTLVLKDKKNSIQCSMCSLKRKYMLALTCSRYTCNQCIQKNLLENESKNRYYCENCKRNHIIKDDQILQHVANKLEKKEAKIPSRQKTVTTSKGKSDRKQITVENSFEILANAAKSSTPKTNVKKVVKKRSHEDTIDDSFKPIAGNATKKPRGQWVKVSSPTTSSFREPSKIFSNKTATTSQASTSKQMEEEPPKIIKKLKFDYERSADSNNRIQMHYTFKLDDIPKQKRGDYTKINIQPFREDKLLFAYNDKFTVRDQNGNIIETHSINRGSSTIITNMCLNDKFIFLGCFNKRDESTSLIKYDHMFNFINQLEFQTECFSLECNENRLFFTGQFGYEYNEKTIVFVIDCNTLKQKQILTGEVDENERVYCTEDLNEPPVTAVYKNRIYFCYQNYNDDNFNRVDYANTDNLFYEGHLEMPEWFLNYRIDSSGNFIYYRHTEKSFLVLNSSGKLLKKLKLDDEIKDTGNFCITNNGRLALVRDSCAIEIY
jgi:hypothetical protein